MGSYRTAWYMRRRICAALKNVAPNVGEERPILLHGQRRTAAAARHASGENMSKPKTAEAFLERVRRLAPELLGAQVDFDALVTHVLRVDPDRMGIRPRRKGRLRKRQRRTSTHQAPNDSESDILFRLPAASRVRTTIPAAQR
jgi:hypothetical protein